MSTKQWLENQHVVLHGYYGQNDCCLCKAETERNEARQVARRLLRERDEWKSKWEREFDVAEDLCSQIRHLESDRDALAGELAEQRKSYAVLTDLCTTIEIERVRMRSALLNIHENGIDIDCPECGADISWSPPDRYFEALGLAK